MALVAAVRLQTALMVLGFVLLAGAAVLIGVDEAIP